MKNADDLQRVLDKVRDGSVVTFTAPSEIKTTNGEVISGKDVVYTGVVKSIHPYHFLIITGVKERLIPRTSILSVGA